MPIFHSHITMIDFSKAIEVRLGHQAVKAKWVRVELRKVETIPSGNHGEEFVDFVGPGPITIWQAKDEHETLPSVRIILTYFFEYPQTKLLFPEKFSI